MKTVTNSVRIPEELDGWLVEYAERRYTSKASIIRQAISELRGRRGPVAGLSFYDWLIMQRDRDEPIGDLAADALRDQKASELPNNRKAWERNCAPQQFTVKEAWLEYSHYRGGNNQPFPGRSACSCVMKPSGKFKTCEWCAERGDKC